MFRHPVRAVLIALLVALSGPLRGADPLPPLSDVADVGLGVDFTCSLDVRGAAWCWGSNEFGQLGQPDGTLTDRPTAVPVVGAGTGLRALAVGAFHACAVTAQGGVKCWGRDFFGALGEGPEIGGPTAVDVVGLRAPATALSAGVGHTCAVLAGGGVKCWGDNEFGQLGDGSTSGRAQPVAVQGLPGPVRRVAASGRATCALTEAGGIHCWGAQYPLLGLDGDSAVARPYPGFESGYVALDAGVFHFCALSTDNRVKCFGDGFNGQFGTGPIDGSLGADSAVGLAPGIVQVAAGGRHTCARSSAGGLQCWGLNTSGQLGIDANTRRLVPTPVAGLDSGVAAITAGGTHSCAITTAGAAKCWGSNNQDSLGDGSQRIHLTPVDVVGLGAGTRAIDAGVDHGCAIDAQRRVRCWGANYDGRLGNGETLNAPTPVEVQGLGAAGATAIAIGESHGCALLEGGAVKCWGTNASGQLGDGTTQNRLGAVDVVGLASGVRAIAAGYAHSCAITASGALKCWGANGSGQLGDGSNAPRTVPTDVAGLGGGVLQVGAGAEHTCAVVSGGAVKCWGFHFFGLVLGDGSTQDRNVPGDVPALDGGVAEVAVGAYSSCARLENGALRCWGVNPIGDNTELGRPEPTPVAGLQRGVTDIDVGFGGHYCAVVDGGAFCWATNTIGQIGDGTTDGVPTPQAVLSDPLERRVAPVAPRPDAPSTDSRSDASGRYVVFQSGATNLAANDTNGAPDIFLTDRETGLTERISLDSTGAQIAGASSEPSISADGRFVVFVAPDAAVGKLHGETAAQRAARRKSNHYAILLRDLLNGTTQRMSGPAMGTGSGSAPRIAPNAGAVVFTSDTAAGSAPGRSNVYVVPLVPASADPGAPVAPGTLRCVSCKQVAGDGSDTAVDTDGAAAAAVISADGRTVAFETRAKNSLAAPSPCPQGGAEILLRDLVSGAMTRVSPPASLPVGACGSAGSTAPSLDYAGQVLAFQTDQALDDDDANGLTDVYWVAPDTDGLPQRLSLSSDGSDGDGASTAPSVSGDGRSIAFVSEARNLDVGFADNNDRADVHAARIDEAGGVERLSRAGSGAEADAASERPTLNYDGTKLSFHSAASALSGLAGGAANVYQRSNPLVAALKSATWWKSSESGWGLTVFDQGNVLAPTWFTYDEDGEPTWFIVGGAFPQSDGSFKGDLLRFTGVAYDRISGPAATSASPIGQVELRYRGENALSFQYSAGGVTQSKMLARFPFGARNFACTVSPGADRSRVRNYTDLWTGGESANAGWGLTVFHIDDGLFAIWYTYDLDGEATFFVVAASRQSDGSFAGTIFKQRNGTPFLQIDDQPPSPASDAVGSATFHFTDGDSGTFGYVIGQTSQSKPIVRLQVGSRAAQCQSETPAG